MKCRLSTCSLGASIIELLAVLCIAAIALSWGANALSSIYSDANLKRAIQRIESTLDYASNYSIANLSKVACYFNQTQQVVSCQKLNEAQAIHPPLRLEPLRITTARFALSGLGTGALVFRPSGIASPGRITVSNGQKSCSIIQAIRGRRRVECV